jgi:Transposase DDE domain
MLEQAVGLMVSRPDKSKWNSMPLTTDKHLTRGKVRSDRQDNIDHYRNLTACSTCALKPRCTPDKHKRLKRWEHEGVLDKMQARLDHMPDAMTIRRQTVEHTFGTPRAASRRPPRCRTRPSDHAMH